MESMSSASESVIEFGASGREDTPRRMPYLRELGSDRRVPTLLAGLGGVAAFASMISEWQVTTMRDVVFADGEVGEARVFPAGLIELGGPGAAYLTGLFLLVTAVVLTLCGPAAGRRYSRLAGLGVGGVQLALVLGMVQMLGRRSLLYSPFLSVQIDDEAPAIDYGRGVWCALAAVAATLAALWLAGRAARPEHGPAPRSRSRVEDDSVPGTPLELSITPAAPFASFPADRDQPLAR